MRRPCPDGRSAPLPTRPPPPVLPRGPTRRPRRRWGPARSPRGRSVFHVEHRAVVARRSRGARPELGGGELAVSGWSPRARRGSRGRDPAAVAGRRSGRCRHRRQPVGDDEQRPVGGRRGRGVSRSSCSLRASRLAVGSSSSSSAGRASRERAIGQALPLAAGEQHAVVAHRDVEAAGAAQHHRGEPDLGEHRPAARGPGLRARRAAGCPGPAGQHRGLLLDVARAGPAAPPAALRTSVPAQRIARCPAGRSPRPAPGSSSLPAPDGPTSATRVPRGHRRRTTSCSTGVPSGSRATAVELEQRYRVAGAPAAGARRRRTSGRSSPSGSSARTSWIRASAPSPVCTWVHAPIAVPAASTSRNR